MNKILIVHTSWYEEDITKMIDISVEILEQKFTCVKAKAPGAIELAALAKSNMQKENAPARDEILASFLAHQARKEMPWSWRVGSNLPTFPDESVEIRSDGMIIFASDK